MSSSSSVLEIRPSSQVVSPSRSSEQPDTMSRTGSPAIGGEDTATMRAWRNARDTYRRSLPEKDFKRIMIPAGPEDVLKEVQEWQSRQSKSKYRRVADGIHAGMSRLEKFNRAIDLIAQGSPAPGCLVWGSIIFVLTVSSSYLS